MNRRTSVIVGRVLLAVAALCWGGGHGLQAQSTGAAKSMATQSRAPMKMHSITNAQRKAAADRSKAKRLAAPIVGKKQISVNTTRSQRSKAASGNTATGGAVSATTANVLTTTKSLAASTGITVGLTSTMAAPFAAPAGCPAPQMNPGGTPDYMSGCVGNWANSPLPIPDPANPGQYLPNTGMRKFVDALPGLGSTGANLLGQYIPVAAPDTTTYGDADYYEIALVQYAEKMHSDLPPTLLRGYVQISTSVVPGNHVPLMNPDGSPILIKGQQAYGVDNPHYLGPFVVARKDHPVRILFRNLLPTGSGGDLFIPVDTTLMGAGMGPNGSMYTQNRATVHLHGGKTPWISDGTPHQWITPADETTAYPKGVSVRDVPDMPPTGPGEMTLFYTNQQSARLMFYHDHAYGITRLNVYAGMAAGYMIRDDAEAALVNAGLVPADEIPLVIQDKTFLPGPEQLALQDPTWNWGPKDTNGNFQMGNLWFSHVYMPNQNPSDLSGANPMGRWDYGPWFWPPMDPSTLVRGEVPCPTAANPSQMCPGVPDVSLTPESFMDTPVVNGTAYPYANVDPKPYRLRILNAANDRMLNLSLYCADPTVTTIDGRANTEVKWTTAPDGIAGQGPIPDPTTSGPPLLQIGNESGFLPEPVVIPPQPVAYNYNRRDIVVLNIQSHALLLGPAERADVIVDFSKAPAGCQNLILYNDAPAPVPAFDTRLDYYTGDPDQTDTGGAPTTIAGFGPNTRTIMQFRLSSPGTGDPAANASATCATTTMCTDLADPTKGLPLTFAQSQPTPIIPESAYSASYPSMTTNSYARIQDTSVFTGSITGVTVTNGGSGYTSAPTVNIIGGGGTGAAATATISGGVVTAVTVTNGGTGYTASPSISFTNAPSDTTGKGAVAIAVGMPITRKAIQELFELSYGRMNATLGVELPFTNFNTQTTIPLGYTDPPTEFVKDGEVQIWKVTHNGVDTHPVHFHLFDVQVINRVGWDGAIRPPEPNELGWKEVVRMNPLEDAIVALRPQKPNLPWGLPDSIRPIDVTTAATTITVTNPADGNPITVPNTQNFGWEYVWHCHILGHEENDFMRPVILQVPPAAPTNLTATAFSQTIVNLAWTINSNTQTGFYIMRGPHGGALAQIAQVGPNASTYTDTTAQAGTAYDYQVVVYNVNGQSPSNIASVTTPDFPPAAPTALTAVAGGPTVVNLAWTDNSNNEAGFNIDRALDSGFTSGVTSFSVGANVTTYVDTTATPSTKFYYRVYAFNSGGNSGYSNTASVTTPTLPQAIRPTLTPSPTAPFQAPVTVTIADATPGATIYYTLDGSTPTTNSTVYSTPIPINVNTTVKAVAIAPGYSLSPVITGGYVIQAGKPTFSPAPITTFTSPQTVTISSATVGATIYYTLDGSTPTTASTVYTAPIPVNVTTTIKAIATAPNMGNSVVVTGTFTINLTTAQPTFTPAATTTFAGPQTVSMSTTTPGASIYYTLDGTTPTTASTLYTAPILISQNTTVKAFAVAPGYSPSTVRTGTYLISAARPTFSPAPTAPFTTAQTVTISSSTVGAQIYYTLDGTTPTTASTLYTAPIPVTQNTTIKAIAVATGYVNSPVATGGYVIRAGAPVFSPAPVKAFVGPQTVTMSSSTPGATIYFTLDGSTPTTASTVYVGPLTISATTTIKAFAVAAGYGNSVVVTGTYTIN